jgi:CubicO group peptidase (beta-lactamase class C family)
MTTRARSEPGTHRRSTIEVLRDDAEGGAFCRGAQLYVSLRGETVFDDAVGVDGMGTPMTTDTLSAVYCAAKPVVALAIARLVDRGECRLDDELGALLPGRLCEELRTVRLHDVLNHTAGLHRHMVVTMAFLGPPRREEVVLRTPPPSDWRPGVDGGYSEYGAWHVLGLVIESIAGGPLRDCIRREVLEPFGLVGDVYVQMSPEEYRAERPRIGVNFDMRGMRTALPLLMERSERVCTEWNPSFGAYANMRGLGHLYEHVLDARGGREAARLVGQATMRAFTEPQRPPVDDVVLGRPCRFGYGFMVDMRAHALGTRCSERTFGHLGFAGSCWAFADPDHDLVVALLSNGLLDPATAIGLRRPVLVDGLYRELGLA